MKYIRPKVGTERVRKYFAILPVSIKRETRWLEVVKVQQKYCWLYCGDNEPKLDWYNLAFAD
jgi:hypothetical protein